MSHLLKKNRTLWDICEVEWSAAIPTNDLWIAASAMEHSAELLTWDAHFLKVVQILVTYIKGA